MHSAPVFGMGGRIGIASGSGTPADPWVPAVGIADSSNPTVVEDGSDLTAVDGANRKLVGTDGSTAVATWSNGFVVAAGISTDGGLLTTDGTGNLTAVSFTGSGAGLTNLPTATASAKGVANFPAAGGLSITAGAVSAAVDGTSIGVNGSNKLAVISAGVVPTISVVTSYAAGTVATLPTTSAQLTFGTTSPGITLATAGTYLLRAAANLQFAGATTTGQTATLKLRRTNNTAADVTGATRTVSLGTNTLVTADVGVVPTPEVSYVAGAGDVIQLWGVISGAIGAGSVQATDAQIIAERIL